MLVFFTAGHTQCSTGSCEQNCTNLSQDGGGFVCHCNDGYVISGDDRTSCLDIDECAKWGNRCPQGCLNVKGSHKCVCDEGFADAARGRGLVCRAQNEKTRLLFSVGYEIRQFVEQVRGW